MAAMEAARGNIEGALQYYNHTLQLLETNFGPSHPALCEALDRIGELMQQSGQVTEERGKGVGGYV